MNKKITISKSFGTINSRFKYPWFFDKQNIRKEKILKIFDEDDKEDIKINVK